MDSSNCLVATINKSQCECSGEHLPLNNLDKDQQLVILTSCGLLRGRDTIIVNVLICESHLSHIQKDYETKRRLYLCLIPVFLSANPENHIGLVCRLWR